MNNHAYMVGSNIIIPGIARFVSADGHVQGYAMFHDTGTLHECNRRDVSGMCAGHEMPKAEFIHIFRLCPGMESLAYMPPEEPRKRGRKCKAQS